MPISEETKLLNFIIFVLKRENLLKKAIVEYNIDVTY